MGGGTSGRLQMVVFHSLKASSTRHSLSWEPERGKVWRNVGKCGGGRRLR